MIAAKSAGKAGDVVAMDDGLRAEAGAGAGAGNGDGVADVVDCDMLGGGGRTLLVDCEGS